MDCEPDRGGKPKDLGLATNAAASVPSATSGCGTPTSFEARLAHVPNPASRLARSPRRQVCIEPAITALDSVFGTVPQGFGQKKVWRPRWPVTRTVTTALETVWQGSGQQLVCWDEPLDLSSRVTQSGDLRTKKEKGTGGDDRRPGERNPRFPGPIGEPRAPAQRLGRMGKTWHADFEPRRPA